MMFRKTLILALCLGFASTVLAETCPTQLTQDKNGYWQSDEKPGWKSHKPTSAGITLSSNSFGGVIYSPKHQRLACVYKASNNEWIAMVSNMYADIKIDDKAMDDSGSKPAWQFNDKQNDYACGAPTVTKLDKCVFNFQTKTGA